MSTMILAGIDEAGYGPLLGPLVLGCCAVRVEADGEAIPDLWKLLKAAVCDKRDRTGRRLHVADSKKVYSPSQKSVGLKELERGVLATAGIAGIGADGFGGFLQAVHADAATAASEIAWYAPPADEAHPAETDAVNVRIAANALRHACGTANVTFLPPAAQVIFEPEYNRLCDALQNKAALQQTVLARLIYNLLESTTEPLTLVCDRQGGRSHYAGFLRQMFGDWDLAVEREDEKRADYRLSRGDQVAKLIFAEKGESLALPTALASMTAKYLRERLMGRFNAWWRQHDAALKPTAGYWTDGQRFLADTIALRERLGIEDRHLVRSR